MKDRAQRFLDHVSRALGMEGRVVSWTIFRDDAEALVDEFQRLRKIEDVSRYLDRCIAEFDDDAPGACSEWFQALADVLEANPRP